MILIGEGSEVLEAVDYFLNVNVFWFLLPYISYTCPFASPDFPFVQFLFVKSRLSVWIIAVCFTPALPLSRGTLANQVTGRPLHRGAPLP